MMDLSWHNVKSYEQYAYSMSGIINLPELTVVNPGIEAVASFNFGHTLKKRSYGPP
ncbi:MAG: hypothetical protein WBM41_07395 [Arenicellales bacterium]